MDLEEDNIDEEWLKNVLSKGTVLTRFTPKQKTKKYFFFDADMWSWYWNSGTKKIEGQVFLHDIREIRPGTHHKDFDKYADEVNYKSEQCFSILYGSEFRLKSVSVMADTPEICRNWILGLAQFVDHPEYLSPPYVLERWQRNCWRQMNPRVDTVSSSDVKKVLKNHGAKFVGKMKQEIEQYKGQNISFYQFQEIYDKITEIGELSILFHQLTKGKDYMDLFTFREFLVNHQKEPRAEDQGYVQWIMEDYNEAQNPNAILRWNNHKFQHYIFSRNNNVMNYAHVSDVYQDMTKPMSHYFISSSHNTYLMGDQLQSESSTEAYIRCLRSGCRCLEIDTWDGSKGIPIVYHGHTLTTKITFESVVKVIADHAFEYSCYPLILSLEDHCCVALQQKMAEMFKKEFGDMLQTTYLDMDAKYMPSPEQLKGKIILKHKKIKPGLGGELMTHNHLHDAENALSTRADNDVSNAIIQGTLYLELTDRIGEKEWTKFYFCLNSEELFWIEIPKEDDEEDDVGVDEEGGESNGDFPTLKGGREEADRILRSYQKKTNGVFLIRESTSYVGEYVCTLWFRNKPEHVRIRRNNLNGRFFLNKGLEFESVRELVAYFCQEPLTNIGLPFCLGANVPIPEDLSSQEWWNGNIGKVEAERMLKMVRKDGAFLLRNSDRPPPAIAISFWAANSVKHCRITIKQDKYYFGTTSFASIIELVSYLKKTYLYRKIKLKYPVNASVVQNLPKASVEEVYDDEYMTMDNYKDPSELFANDSSTVRALCDFKPDAQYTDALTFSQNAIIRNVKMSDSDWWYGEYCGQKGYFPANYVEQLAPPTQDDGKKLNMERGSLKINRHCKVELCGVPVGRFSNVLKVTPQDGPSLYLATEEDAENRGHSILAKWKDAIITQTEDQDSTYQTQSILGLTQNIDHHLSDLIAYCSSIRFQSFEHSRNNSKHYEMSSFAESDAMRWTKKAPVDFVEYNRRQFSRIYPAGKRVDSSNYDPQPLWNAGCQLVALNYQTPDKPMQINRGRFKQNGDCGYVLKPAVMNEEGAVFNCFQATTFKSRVKTLKVSVLGARHLPKLKGTASPFVSCEIIGVRSDSGGVVRSKTQTNNGLCPMWAGKESGFECQFEIKMPELAMLRFLVEDEDMFGDPNFLAQATIPVDSLMTGYRCVPLSNGYDENIPMAALCVKIDIEVMSSEKSEKIYEVVHRDELIRGRIDFLENSLNDIQVKRITVFNNQNGLDKNSVMSELNKIDQEILKTQKEKESLESQLLQMMQRKQMR